MSHPGPPRFLAAGEEIELAPRDPDPAATYRWRLVGRPDGSEVELGDDPVEHFTPDVPGTYLARLSAPDGEHDLTIRVFPGELSPGRSQTSGVSAGGTERAVGTADSPDRSERSARTGADTDAEATRAGGRPRLTLTPSIEGEEAVVRADAEPHPEGTETVGDLAVEFLIDDRDDVNTDRMRARGHELRLPVDALPDRLRVHAVAVGDGGYSVPDAVEFSREGESDPAPDGGTDARPSGIDDRGVATTRLYDPPAWAEDSLVYEIYLRTFTEAETGSTFDAIVDRLDYIESLGVDVLWLTPVLENDHAPHGYNITDFFAIASDLGSRDDYERFVEAAHDHGLKVLFDLVCNHSARTHPYFQEAVSDPDSEYRDWYEWRTETDPETYFDWEHIANFDFDHLPVRRHLLDAVEEWAPLVDGFRCDMAWAVPNGFWREIHDRCKDRDSDFLLLDETIPYIPDFHGGLFDVHFDSTTYFALRQVGHGADAEAILDAIDDRARSGFPDHAGFMLYAENHDETRYIVDCGRPAAEAAAGAVFTLPGAPMVYAGQEFGQRGQRDTLAWEHADERLQEFVRSLADVRHRHPALSADGDHLGVPYEVRNGDPGPVVAYARTATERAAVVVLNFGADPATVAVPAAADATDLVTGDSVAAGDGTDTTVRVDSVVVLPASVGQLGR